MLVVLNSKFYHSFARFIFLSVNFIAGVCGFESVYAASVTTIEPVQACVFASTAPLSTAVREQVADCLGWQQDDAQPFCRGRYQTTQMPSIANADEIQIQADSASFYPSGRSTLQGNVSVRQVARIVNAQTAYVYRDEKTNQVTQIELLNRVRYVESGKLMLAKQANINPQDNSGRIEDVLYLFHVERAHALLPAWGRASFVERFANKDYLLRNATYSTCAPRDKAWLIEAREIKLDDAKGTGVAKNAVLRVGDWPVLYSPYLSFPTSNERKSGFLMPIYGYSNVSGFDLATPYYLNIAPNVDATIVPHSYSLRGVMMGGNLRFLTSHSQGLVEGNFLPNDRAFNEFLITNREQFPSLRGLSDDRWSFLLRDDTQLTDNLHMKINYRQVSDDYYLQNFSSNLAVMTENQLLRQGDLTYTTDHWLFNGMLQSYQTLHPMAFSTQPNQSLQAPTVSDAYERLPQLKAQGFYDDLPLNANVSLLGQFDYFIWPDKDLFKPKGSRYHANPIVSFPHIASWGYVTPEVQMVENYYDLQSNTVFPNTVVNRTIPRYSLDSGLSFERTDALFGAPYTQTLEPRLYYLYVPYQNQSVVPAFDSAYMIFNTDQLFRTNRFSGFDRIGDANQLAYAATTRWMSATTGREQASLTVGQLRYFATRRVQLCEDVNGNCTDSPDMLGFVSPTAKSSPIASKATLQVSRTWAASADYVWDVYTHATNNGDLNIHYRPADNKMLRFGYSYLLSGNLLETSRYQIQNKPLHQATLAGAWPLTQSWSGIGAYSYNISEGYNMMAFAGVQYDTCCWAFRFLGGHTFKSLAPDSLTPQYNNNVYFQVLLKGLGSVALSDPASTIETYLPGYPNLFQ
jgi:LPS-assembly protein